MTTEMNEATDVDALIDGLTDAQLDRLTLRLRRRTNEKIKQAALEAAIKKERERQQMPEQQVQRFVRNYESIPSVFDPRQQVQIYENGASLVPVNRALAMPGAVEVIEQPSTDPLRRCQVMFHFHETTAYVADLRRQEVVHDNAMCATSRGFANAGPENAAELARVDAIIKEARAVAEQLSNLCTTIHQVQRQHAGQERDQLIAEAVATVPAAAKWMTPAGGNA